MLNKLLWLLQCQIISDFRQKFRLTLAHSNHRHNQHILYISVVILDHFVILLNHFVVIFAFPYSLGCTLLSFLISLRPFCITLELFCISLSSFCYTLCVFRFQSLYTAVLVLTSQPLICVAPGYPDRTCTGPGHLSGPASDSGEEELRSMQMKRSTVYPH